MQPIFITLNSFQSKEVQEKGQGHFFPLIAHAGAQGAEIRRELFSEEGGSLQDLRTQLEEAHLTSVYSAPVDLFNVLGSLNKEAAALTVMEAITLGASLVKFSLGHYNMQRSSVTELKEWLASLSPNDHNLQITIENDQTNHGGSLEKIHHFLKEAKEQHVPVKMTFDIGNWSFTGEDVFSAAKVLSEYVVYLHFKHIEQQNGRLVTLPLPAGETSEWRELVSHFSNDIPRAIEFPISDGNEACSYTALLANA
ncbi:sugar phosphate isomerase/epimerase family protein [Fictibacillus terranigra]|uniref:TIM barrel protein n=1 Tax=Fictibacillus terranigra TaxID=3058424 RepID=A0ABT8E1R4_9BACL|nr:TIM barrel protein [Fictibacillus sp. CENA-BCM004]MDN4071842.1 TIM barrel protein [Fictibacillus sp. CENA-BCM004]